MIIYLKFTLYNNAIQEQEIVLIAKIFMRPDKVFDNI